MAFTEAQIAEMKAAGLTDAAIAELAAFNPEAFQQQQMANQGAVSAKDAAALAAAQQAGISNIDYYVNPLGAGDIIPGLVPSIMQNLGMYDPAYWAVMQTYGSEANQANPLDVTEKDTFAVNPTLSYRLVDGSGKVLGTANTPQEIAALVAQANQLSQDKGAKAVWSLEQSTIPAGAVTDTNKMGWVPVASDQNSELLDTPMKLILAGMLATTAAGALQAGGFAGAGSGAAGGGATGGAVGAGAAGTAAGGTAAGGAIGAGATGTAAAGATTSGLLSTVAPAAGDIVVTGAIPAAITPATVIPAVAPAVVAPVVSGGTTPQAPQSTGPATTPEEIVVTGSRGLTTPEIMASLGIVPSTLIWGSQPPPPSSAPATTQKPGGILGKPVSQWSVTDWLTAASLGGGLLQSIIGQPSGQGSTGYPYSSGFGGLGPNAGKDMRVNPNITDYETYGFGPEATFFSQDYNKIVPGAMTSRTTTPTTYKPLING